MSGQKNNLQMDQIPRGPLLLLRISIYIDSCIQRVRLLRAPDYGEQFVTHCESDIVYCVVTIRDFDGRLCTLSAKKIIVCNLILNL